jgi:hypothetical protein
MLTRERQGPGQLFTENRFDIKMATSPPSPNQLLSQKPILCKNAPYICLHLHASSSERRVGQLLAQTGLL